MTNLPHSLSLEKILCTRRQWWTWWISRCPRLSPLTFLTKYKSRCLTSVYNLLKCKIKHPIRCTLRKRSCSWSQMGLNMRNKYSAAFNNSNRSRRDSQFFNLTRSSRCMVSLMFKKLTIFFRLKVWKLEHALSQWRQKMTTITIKAATTSQTNKPTRCPWWSLFR